jgi:imidazolonepropionase-like amidohydrolase
VDLLYCDAALADGRSPTLELGVSILVRDGHIAWIRPTDSEEEAGDAEVIDAGGATIVPGMIDCHSHLTLPGGSHWIDRGNERRRALGARRLRPAWIPSTAATGRSVSASAIAGAGTWSTRTSAPPGRGSRVPARCRPGLTAEAEDGDELLRLATAQLDDGADLIKLYLDGPDPETAPWTASEVERVVAAAHARGAKVTAHAGRLEGARVCADGGVDCIEHGFELDADSARLMAERGIALVSTLTCFKSWTTSGQTTEIPRFASAEGRTAVATRWGAARESVRVAHAAGVLLGAGTDFGGGSGRANQLAWEVETLVEAGIEPWEALAAVTWKAGEILAEPGAGEILEDGTRTSSSSTAIRSPTRPRSGASGGSPGSTPRRAPALSENRLEPCGVPSRRSPVQTVAAERADGEPPEHGCHRRAQVGPARRLP